MRLLALLLAACAVVSADDRAVAEWVLLMGGAVRTTQSRERLQALDALPEGEIRIESLDLIGVNLFPADLERFSGLRDLRELRLPGPIWSRNADGGKNLSAELGRLSSLPALERLTFSDHFLDRIRFDDSGLEAIASLTGLRELGLRQTTVKGPGLAPFRNLEILDLSRTRMDDAGLEFLVGMRSLRILRLADTLVTGRGLSQLQNLTALEELDLSGVPVDDAALPSLARLTNLRKLDLSGADITDDGLRALAPLTQLEELHLYRTKVSNVGLEQLASLAHLRETDLRYTRATAAGAARLQETLPAARIRFVAAGRRLLRVRPRFRPSRATLRSPDG
ncbi:MAG: hypothetical protein R2724_17450 [Bryobacterales bacterium]